MAIVVVAPFAPRGPAYAAHSATEQAIVGFGLISFVVQPNLSLTPGMRVRISAVASDSWMEGIVKTYAGTTLTIEIHLSEGGGGPYKAWNINLAGEPGITPTYAGSVTNARLSESRASNAATFKLVTLAGSVPTDVNVVSAVFTNGALRLITDASVYVTIPAGTKLGTVDQTPFRLWFLLIDDGGVVTLGAIQTRSSSTNSIQGFPPNGIIPAAMFAGVGTTTSGVIFTNDGPISVARPYIVVGFADYDSGLSTAGNWNVAPTRLVMFGPGIKLPGDELQTKGNQTGVYAGYTDITIPLDNTPPLHNEGIHILGEFILPRCPQSVLEIEVQAIVSFEDTARTLTAALVRPTTSSPAIATTWTSQTRGHLYLWTKQFAGSTLSTTFSVNIGLDAAGSFALNGDNTGSRYGGSSNSYIQITERQT